MLLWDLHGESGLLQDFSCGLRRLGAEVVVESVRPKNDFVVGAAESRMFITRHSLLEPATKSLRGKFRNATLKRHTSGQFRQMAEPRRLCEQIHHSRPERCQPRPLID